MKGQSAAAPRGKGVLWHSATEWVFQGQLKGGSGDREGEENVGTSL